MKVLSSFIVINIDGGDRISYTYNELNAEGEIISSNNKKSFYIMDDALKSHVEAIREYIKSNKFV